MPTPNRRQAGVAFLGAALALATISCASKKPPVPRTAEERFVEQQMTFMAQQTVGDYLVSEGIPPNGVLTGPPKRTADGWDFDVWRKGDRDAATVVRVKETAEVSADDLDAIRPKAQDFTFKPRQTKIDPNAVYRQP